MTRLLFCRNNWQALPENWFSLASFSQNRDCRHFFVGYSRIIFHKRGPGPYNDFLISFTLSSSIANIQLKEKDCRLGMDQRLGGRVNSENHRVILQTPDVDYWTSGLWEVRGDKKRHSLENSMVSLRIGYAKTLYFLFDRLITSGLQQCFRQHIKISARYGSLKSLVAKTRDMQAK